MHNLSALFLSLFTATSCFAEATVYYCNTSTFAQVKKDDLSNVRSYPLIAMLDISAESLKLKGEALSRDFTSETFVFLPTSKRVWAESESQSVITKFDTDTNTLFYSNIMDTLISSFIASCESF